MCTGLAIRSGEVDTFSHCIFLVRLVSFYLRLILHPHNLSLCPLHVSFMCVEFTIEPNHFSGQRVNIIVNAHIVKEMRV